MIPYKLQKNVEVKVNINVTHTKCLMKRQYFKVKNKGVLGKKRKWQDTRIGFFCQILETIDPTPI